MAIGVSVLVFAFATGAHAVAPNGESGTGNRVQQQAQTANRGETTQLQNGERQQARAPGNSDLAERRRSRVADAVREMLQVADRSGGIGQQVRDIARAQIQGHEGLEANLERIRGRSGLARFFFGPNYGEINSAQRALETNREQVRELNRAQGQVVDQGEAQELAQQIRVLEEVNLEIEGSLEGERKGFSLFGWIFRAFSD